MQDALHRNEENLEVEPEDGYDEDEIKGAEDIHFRLDRRDHLVGGEHSMTGTIIFSKASTIGVDRPIICWWQAHH